MGKRGCPCGWSGRVPLHLAHGKVTDLLASHREGRQRTTSPQNGCTSDPAGSVGPKGRDIINQNEVDLKTLHGLFKATQDIIDEEQCMVLAKITLKTVAFVKLVIG